MVLVSSITNFFSNKKSHTNKWMRKKIPTCRNSALVLWIQSQKDSNLLFFVGARLLFYWLASSYYFASVNNTSNTEELLFGRKLSWRVTMFLFSFAKLSHNLFIHLFFIRFISFVIPRVCKDRYTLIMPKTMAHISYFSDSICSFHT